MDRLLAVSCCLKVADLGSFSAAARALERPQSQVSRLVAQLEAQLGVTLFERTTRRVALTAAGRTYLKFARRAVEDLDEGAAALRAGKARVQGKVRIAASSEVTRHFLIDLASDLLAEHPGLELDLEIDDRHLDLVAENLDIALRVGEFPPVGVIARKLGEFARVVVASPRYLKETAGMLPLQHPESLPQHENLMHTRWPERQLAFIAGSNTTTVELKGRLGFSVGEFAVDGALRGLGVAVTPRFACETYLRSGELVELFPGHRLAPLPVHAVYAPSRRQTARVAVVMEALLRRFAPRRGD